MSHFQNQQQAHTMLRRRFDALEALVRRVITPDGQVRFDGTTTVGVLPTHDHTGTGEGGDIDGTYATDAELAAHIADSSDAHDASAISILDAAADFTATNVEDALAELQSDNEAHVAAADPHTGYVREADANWIDLTDGGASTLHSHAGGGSTAAVAVDIASGSLDATGLSYILVGGEGAADDELHNITGGVDGQQLTLEYNGSENIYVYADGSAGSKVLIDSAHVVVVLSPPNGREDVNQIHLVYSSAKGAWIGHSAFASGFGKFEGTGAGEGLTGMSVDVAGEGTITSYVREEIVFQQTAAHILNRRAFSHEIGEATIAAGQWIPAAIEDNRGCFEVATEGGAASDRLVGMSNFDDSNEAGDVIYLYAQDPTKTVVIAHLDATGESIDNRRYYCSTGADISLDDNVKFVKCVYREGMDGAFSAWVVYQYGAAGGSGSVATDTIFDAKGDLPVGTGADTAAKLTVGADDTILMADAATATGLKYVASAAGSTQAFGDAAAVGTDDTFTRGGHKHAMPADPVTAHNAAFAHGDIAGHIADASDAHDASAISADSTTLVGTGTDVQAVLEELDNGIADHLADASDAHDASAVSNVPAGTVAATTVQAAIDELATDYAAADSTHAGAADPHAGYVLESLIDAAGDLYKGSGDNAVARLAAPTDQKFLGGTGVAYAYPVQSGVYASRPAASTANVGTLYMATDRQNTVYLCNTSSTWIIVSPRRMEIVWYIDARPRYAPTARAGRLWRLPADLGPWKPIRALAHVVTAPVEGATATGTATSGSTTTLADTGKAWTTNQWQGAVCTISAGAQSGKAGRVLSNTATVLTFENAFSGAIDNTSVYALVSGIRVQIETGSTDTPSTNLWTEPASDATTEQRLRIAPAAVSGTTTTFSDTSFAADDRIELLIDGVGALPGSEGYDLSVTLEIEQLDG